MCVASAGRVLAIDGSTGDAVVDSDGRRVVVSLAPLLLDNKVVDRGDWVLVHTGFAVAVITESEAHDLLDAVRVPAHPGGQPA